MSRGSLPGRGLEPSSRESLLAKARNLASHLDRAAARQAASALSILRAGGARELRSVLDGRLEVHLGASSRHWRRFLEVCGAEVHRVAATGEQHTAFLLAWLNRFGTMERPKGPQAHQRRRG